MEISNIFSSISDSEIFKKKEQTQLDTPPDKHTSEPLSVCEIGFTDEAASEDKFGIINYIGGLANFVAVCSTPLTISIQGSWGTGKTSIMNLVKKELPDDVFPVWFNTWQFSQFNMSEQLPVSLLSNLVSAFGLKGEDLTAMQEIIKGLGYVYSVGKGLGLMAVGAYCGSEAADAMGKAAQKFERRFNNNDNSDVDPALSIKKLKEEFIKCVNKALETNRKRRIVIFIDDLDRLNPGKAVELLEVLKLFLDCKNCVFVLAIDYDVVCRGVKEKYGEDMADEKGRSFFDKIIQVPFKMPVARYKIEEYVKDCFKQIDIGVNTEEEVKVYVDLIKYSIGTNPRSMKRLFNAFQLLIEIVRQEGANEETKKDISNDVKYKQLLFAILCLQHCSEPIYNFMILNKGILTVEMFESLISDNYDSFIEIAERGNADVEDLEQIDFDSAKPFLGKLKEAIDLNGNKGIEQKELENFVNVMDFTSITNATDTEPTKPTNRGSQFLDNYTQLNLKGNSTKDVEHILELINRMGNDIDILFVRRKSGEDTMRGKVNGNKTFIIIYGLASGYYGYICAPESEVLADANKYPQIVGLMQEMKVVPDNIDGKAVRISIYRGGKKAETEEKMVELGRLVYNEWKKRE